MLSFIHHKSTGDMLAEFATGGANLAAAEPTSVNRSSSNIIVVKRATQKRQRNQHQQRKQQQPPVCKLKQQVYTSLQVNEYHHHEKEDYKDEDEDDNDDDDDDDKEEELKCKPLLLTSTYCEDEPLRWSSTKYLTGSADSSNRCASSNGRKTEQQVTATNGNRWSLQRQFKSIGDFLADTANIWPTEQRQRSVEPHLNSSTPVVVALQLDNERPASSSSSSSSASSSSSSSSSLLSVDVVSSNQLLRSAPPPPVAAPELDEPNGAQKRPLQRRRRAAIYEAAKSNHRLSLSSPMLSQQQQQQQQQPYEMNSSNDSATNKAAAKLENLRKGQQQVGKDHDDTGGETKLADRYDRFQCIVVANDHDHDDRQDSSAQSTLSSNSNSSSGCYSTCNEDAVATTEATGGEDLGRKERETQQQNQVSNSIDNHLMANVETAAAAAAVIAHCGCLTCEQSKPVAIEPSHEREKSYPINIMPLPSHQKRLRHPIQQAVNRQQLADIQKCGSEQSNNVSNATSNSNSNNNSNNNNNNNNYDNNSQRVATTTAANDCTAQQVAALTNGQQSQTGGGTVHHNQQQPNHLSTTGSLMVDLNCIASKLMSVPGQSLRQALQPSHSGSYKVCSLEQQQQVSASGQQQVLSQQQRDWISRKQQQQQQQRENSSNVLLSITTATTTTDKEYARETREHTTTKRNASAANNLLQQTTRISRPGRSPVSLQRQTNARLAKHRLKIQQQRQEQLEQLAQREQRHLNVRQQQQRSSFAVSRQQQVPSSQSSVLSNLSQDRHDINSCQPIGQASNINNSSNVNPATKTLQVASSFLQESVQLFYGLRDKLSLNNSNLALPNNHQLYTNDNNYLQSQPTQVTDQVQDTSSLSAVINNSRLAPQQHRRFQQQQHPLQSNLSPIQSNQVIIPTTSRAFEICDNQLAGCSSRLDRNTIRSTINNSNNNGNVIAYNPINMLRPVQNSFNQSSSRQHLCHNHQLSNGSSRRHHGSSRAAGHNNNNHRHYCQQTSAKCDAADEVIVEEEASESDMDNRQTNLASSSSFSSNASSSLSLNKPFCKICHIGSSKLGDKLISPCRCSGTMQYIHCGCLLKWLEISNRTNEKPMSCELCAHEYTWHKKFNYRRMQMPKCSLKDILLHVIFIAAVGVMFMSALAPMLHKRSTAAPVISSSPQQQSPPSSSGSLHKAQANFDSANEITGINNGRNNRHHMSIPIHHSSSFNGQSNHLVTGGRLASDEKFMLLCAASFFISFFLAIYVQTKARDTLYGLIVKFLTMNQTFYITEYDHGQLNSSSANNNNNINNSTGSNSGGNSNANGSDINIKQQYQQQHQNHHQQQHQQQYHDHSQQEQQFYSVNSRPDRKSSVKS